MRQLYARLDQIYAKLDPRIPIGTNTTPRHVPARIIAVPDLPRTRSGKVVELAVKQVVNGLPVDNLQSLENPAALDHFRDLPQLR
jgi:acetoacetyl-CoA synthetase